MINGNTLQLLRRSDTPDWEKVYGAPFLLFHGVDLHNELKRMATKPRANTSSVARVKLFSEVTDIDLDGHMTLADGTTMVKDLIVVANGIGVRTRSHPY